MSCFMDYLTNLFKELLFVYQEVINYGQMIKFKKSEMGFIKIY